MSLAASAAFLTLGTSILSAAYRVLLTNLFEFPKTPKAESNILSPTIPVKFSFTPLTPPLAKDKITSSTKPVPKLVINFLATLFVTPFDRRLLAVLPIEAPAPPPNTNPVAAPKAVYLI